MKGIQTTSREPGFSQKKVHDFLPKENAECTEIDASGLMG